MAFPNIPSALDALYKPQLNFSQIGSFLGSIPSIYKDQPQPDLNTAISNAQTVTQNEYKLAAQKRANDQALLEDERSKQLADYARTPDQAGNLPTFNDILQHGRNIAVQQAELPDALKLQEAAQQQQDYLGKALGITKGLAEYSPDAAKQFLSNNEAARGLGLDNVDSAALAPIINIPARTGAYIKNGNELVPLKQPEPYQPRAGYAPGNYIDPKTHEVFYLNPNDPTIAERGLVKAGTVSTKPVDPLLAQLAQPKEAGPSRLDAIRNFFKNLHPAAAPSQSNDVIQVRKINRAK